jgi:hypothetical protein
VKKTNYFRALWTTPVIALCAIAGCGAPDDSIDDAIENVDTARDELYYEEVAEKPNCCPGHDCCLKWCDYHRDKCVEEGGLKCESARVTCRNKCDNSHG